MIFQGNCPALITPFTKSNKINFKSLKNLLDNQILGGAKAILILGTTGENATLSTEEKIEIIKFTLKTVDNKVPVIVGAGSNNTSIAIKTAQLYESLGVNALLEISPYYNKTTQSGLVEHFSQIAKSINIPIILYNVPSRTGVNILPETVFKLSKIYNIVGIKEASGNLNQVSQIIKLCSKDFAVYSGDDALTLPMLSLGAQGVFSVASNLLPKEMSCLCENFFNGNVLSSQKIHYKLLDLFNILFCEVNPIPVKTALNIMHKNVGKVRLPLTNIQRKNYIKLKNILKKIDWKISIFLSF